MFLLRPDPPKPCRRSTRQFSECFTRLRLSSLHFNHRNMSSHSFFPPPPSFTASRNTYVPPRRGSKGRRHVQVREGVRVDDESTRCGSSLEVDRRRNGSNASVEDPHGRYGINGRFSVLEEAMSGRYRSKHEMRDSPVSSLRLRLGVVVTFYSDHLSVLPCGCRIALSTGSC